MNLDDLSRGITLFVQFIAFFKNFSYAYGMNNHKLMVLMCNRMYHISDCIYCDLSF